MDIQSQVNDLRNSKAPIWSTGNTHRAVIVKIFVEPNVFSVGIQYWTSEEIEIGFKVNSDGTKSELIDLK